MKPVMVLAQQGFPAPRCVPSLVVRMGRSQITLCMYLPWLCPMHIYGSLLIWWLHKILQHWWAFKDQIVFIKCVFFKRTFSWLWLIQRTHVELPPIASSQCLLVRFCIMVPARQLDWLCRQDQTVLNDLRLSISSLWREWESWCHRGSCYGVHRTWVILSWHFNIKEWKQGVSIEKVIVSYKNWWRPSRSKRLTLTEIVATCKLNITQCELFVLDWHCSEWQGIIYIL